MKFGNKKPEKIPMYVYYIIAGVIIVLLNMLVVPAVQERSVQKTDCNKGYSRRKLYIL